MLVPYCRRCNSDVRLSSNRYVSLHTYGKVTSFTSAPCFGALLPLARQTRTSTTGGHGVQAISPSSPPASANRSCAMFAYHLALDTVVSQRGWGAAGKPPGAPLALIFYPILIIRRSPASVRGSRTDAGVRNSVSKLRTLLTFNIPNARYAYIQSADKSASSGQISLRISSVNEAPFCLFL